MSRAGSTRCTYGSTSRRPLTASRPAAHLRRYRPRCSDHSLHVVRLGSSRIGKHDHVTAAAAAGSAGNRALRARDLRTVDHFVDEEEIAREQRARPCCRWRFERLRRRTSDDEEQHQRHPERAHPAVEPSGQSGAAPFGSGRGSRGPGRGRLVRLSHRAPQVKHVIHFTRVGPLAQRSPPTPGRPPTPAPGPGSPRGSRGDAPAPRDRPTVPPAPVAAKRCGPRAAVSRASASGGVDRAASRTRRLSYSTRTMLAHRGGTPSSEHRAAGSIHALGREDSNLQPPG